MIKRVTGCRQGHFGRWPLVLMVALLATGVGQPLALHAQETQYEFFEEYKRAKTLFAEGSYALAQEVFSKTMVEHPKTLLPNILPFTMPWPPTAKTRSNWPATASCN